MRIIILFILFFSSSVFAESLIVYGSNFAFSVKEPMGWVGDIKNAERYHANVIFHSEKPSLKGDIAIIRVRVNGKVDENTKADLEYDAKGYKNKYPKVKFRDISLKHEKYKIYSRLFFVPKSFYEYVAYINPGIKNKVLFSVSMNIQKNEASESEIKAYSEVVSSILLLYSMP